MPGVTKRRMGPLPHSTDYKWLGTYCSKLLMWHTVHQQQTNYATLATSQHTVTQVQTSYVYVLVKLENVMSLPLS